MKTELLLLFYLLAVSLAAGFALGLWRDLLLFIGRVLRELFLTRLRLQKVAHLLLEAAQDLGFCLLVGFVLSVILFYYNEGRIRFFAVMALLLGFLLYRGSVGRLFSRFSLPVAQGIAKGVTWLFASLMRPLRWLCNRVSRPIRALGQRIVEQHLRRYHAARMNELGKISKKGFVNI